MIATKEKIIDIVNLMDAGDIDKLRQLMIKCRNSLATATKSKACFTGFEK